ncbi:HI1506-related protein [Kaistia dalseonensis]|uniref:Mu-like prophage FluMu N-terminal domain-containing protein n=1 Tax=Kaistia dalseonensis TaxID=410840 RepID=A0ABU0HCB9_9HYPH|nr:HI1506-related protein [Kaistia dalseonensis]MCX5497322.1 HI1506-related protein [Kaistia dalseonensis]MDQ0439959.1 hypothetical protein [Kaistia dalseonensis]
MPIRIICRFPGFRRAGVAHSADRTWPDGRFTSDEIKLLKAEPLLTVIEIDKENTEAPPTAKAGAHQAEPEPPIIEGALTTAEASVSASTPSAADAASAVAPAAAKSSPKPKASKQAAEAE